MHGQKKKKKEEAALETSNQPSNLAFSLCLKNHFSIFQKKPHIYIKWMYFADEKWEPEVSFSEVKVSGHKVSKPDNVFWFLIEMKIEGLLPWRKKLSMCFYAFVHM